MDKVKFVLTFLMAAGIIMGGYFFANRTDVHGEKDIKQLRDRIALSNPLSAIGSGSATGGAQSSAYAPSDANGNITRMVAQSLFSRMRQMDQSGESPIGELNASTPEAAAMIEYAVKSVPSTIFITAIDTKDIKTATDNTIAAKRRYLEGIDTITKRYFSGTSAERFNITSSQELIDNVEQDCFGSGMSQKNKELNTAYRELYEAYKALPVPSSWIALHKMILGYFKELSDIYGAFIVCKEDPIRAYVGLDRLPIVYARAQDIQNMLDKKIKELGL